MAALSSNQYSPMVARLATCRLGATRLGVVPKTGLATTTTIGAPKRNIKWTPDHPLTTTAWTLDKS